MEPGFEPVGCVGFMWIQDGDYGGIRSLNPKP